ncbi:PAS domain S-box protein [Saccharophagus degradans]|uniref:PAS domain-containing sensor histidine kinase n=1 Tax=Saccharophagus degradans TaxID=86304 RepID=UPI001C09D26D|nr:ATP-binding protein [Saccharophagus degradans]MBU2985436.1 PAS domain S-box protein [Saccharophagus degradans]
MSHYNQHADIPFWIASWPDGIVALDNNCNILFVSAKAQSIFGWHQQDLEGKHIHDALCVANIATAHSKLDCPLCQTEHLDTEIQSANWLTASGDYLSVDFRVIPIESPHNTARLINFSANHHRIHNQAEMKKLADYVDNNPAPLVEFDRDGQMLFGNPALQEALLTWGFDEEGQATIFPDNLLSLCEQCLDSGTSITGIEVTLGQTYLSWHFHPIVSESVVTVLGYAFDISKQKNAELEAKEARAQARRDFYAKMMHELRTPLNAIIGFSDVLLWRSAAKLDERDNTALRNIKVAGIQLNEMITDTLDISKIEAGKMVIEPETFVASLLLHEMQEQMRYLAEAKGLTYHSESNADIPFHSDKKKIRQVLVNLISNAIKYTKNGDVWVSVIQITNSIQTTESELVITVKDTGIGIPEDQINSLFEAYQRVKESKNKDIQGTGIGLALVWELIHLLNGEIKVESIYGQGSTFTAKFPYLPKTN